MDCREPFNYRCHHLFLKIVFNPGHQLVFTHIIRHFNRFYLYERISTAPDKFIQFIFHGSRAKQ